MRFRAVPHRAIRDLLREAKAGAVSGAHPRHPRPLVAVDLGYASAAAATGLFFTGGPPRLSLRFGEIVERAAVAFAKGASPRRPLLLLEAPLSGRHGADGGPVPRTPPETDAHPWFQGAAAAAALGALAFLRALDDRLGTAYPHRVDLVEAYLPEAAAAASVGQKSLVPWKVARMLHDRFAEARWIHHDAWRPLSPLVNAAPVILDYR